MHCKKVKNHLEQYADGTLEIAFQTKLKEHLSECSACSLAFKEIESLKSIFKETALPPLPKNSLENIMAAVRHSLADKRQDENEGFSFRWWTEATLSARMVFACILIIILAVGSFIGKDLWKDSKPMTYNDDPEIEAFSAAQKGSLEYFYLTMTASPLQGVKK